MADKVEDEEKDEIRFESEGWFTHWVCCACGHNDWTEGDIRGEQIECPVCHVVGRVDG